MILLILETYFIDIAILYILISERHVGLVKNLVIILLTTMESGSHIAREVKLTSISKCAIVTGGKTQTRVCTARLVKFPVCSTALVLISATASEILAIYTKEGDLNETRCMIS